MPQVSFWLQLWKDILSATHKRFKMASNEIIVDDNLVDVLNLFLRHIPTRLLACVVSPGVSAWAADMTAPPHPPHHRSEPVVHLEEKPESAQGSAIGLLPIQQLA